eukprot:858946-Pleurochrysis_carterae.AAC.1
MVFKCNRTNRSHPQSVCKVFGRAKSAETYAIWLNTPKRQKCITQGHIKRILVIEIVECDLFESDQLSRCAQTQRADLTAFEGAHLQAHLQSEQRTCKLKAHGVLTTAKWTVGLAVSTAWTLM